MKHDARLEMAWDVLEGLSVGDALGEATSYNFYEVRDAIDKLQPGACTLRYTDDTEMASVVYDTLSQLKGIDEDYIAWSFAMRFRKDPDRGYGRMARRTLEEIYMGTSWKEVSPAAFGGGSFGNGAAMRVAPIGAYFYNDYTQVMMMAERSAKVTHYHPEGIAGAVAVALATAEATKGRTLNDPDLIRTGIVESLKRLLPEGRTRSNFLHAISRGFDAAPQSVSRDVGNGSEISAQDTVPFCIWNAARMIDNYEEAILSTIEVGGDCDTNCAIVGGIVSAYLGKYGIPEKWKEIREPLKVKI